MNIVIVGAGEIGFQLAKRLSNERHNITIIEIDQSRANYSREHLDALIIDGSGSSYKTLIKAGIENADIFAALCNHDEINMMACRIAKRLGNPTTIARVRNPEYLDEDYIFSKSELGTDFIIQPEKQTAKSIIRLVRQSSATDVIEFEKGKIQFIGIRLDGNSPVLHTQLKDLGKKYGNPPITIVAIKRRQFTIIPRGDDYLKKGDQIFIICAPDFIEEALGYFGKQDTKVEDLMIIGGGLIGEFVAQELEKDIRIKIIEKDRRKAERLADNLHESLVIHGDGSDFDLLTFEGMDEMDEFIAVTGDDETNIITSLVAQHVEVPRTITMISKMEYQSLMPAIGMDSIISKQLITVNAIQRFIRKKHVAFFAEIPGVDAEIIEYIPEKRSKIIKKQLKDIKFPENAVVGAVLKNNDHLEIPKGDTQIDAGDKVIVFTLPNSLKEVEKLF